MRTKQRTDRDLGTVLLIFFLFYSVVETVSNRQIPGLATGAVGHSLFLLPVVLIFDFAICNLLLELQKPPAPVALQGRLCLSAKPHEYKRSLVRYFYLFCNLQFAIFCNFFFFDFTQ